MLLLLLLLQAEPCRLPEEAVEALSEALPEEQLLLLLLLLWEAEALAEAEAEAEMLLPPECCREQRSSRRSRNKGEK
jgi:hypothetical protein